MPIKQNHIALLGGTFDPIHNGHLQIAHLVIEKLNFKQVIFIPNHQQLLRQPAIATMQQRLAMLRLAINNNKFIINTCELERPGPSYTIDTIKYITKYISEYARDQSPAILWLILGLDAFTRLPQWHQFDKLIQSCNFIVVNREQEQDNQDNQNSLAWAKNYLKNHTISLADKDNMHNTDRYGTVILLDLLDTGLINISASGIRNIIYNHANLQNLEKLRQEQTDTLINKLKKLMPNPVVDYILEQNLYT